MSHRKLPLAVLFAFALAAGVLFAEEAGGPASVTQAVVAAVQPGGAAPEVDSRLFELVHANAMEVAENFNRTWKAQPGVFWSVNEIAVPFAEQNSVMVTAPKPILAACEKMIARLDRKPRQVYVEARFVELSNIAEHNIGIHWGALEAFGIKKGNFAMSYTRRNDSDLTSKTTVRSGDTTTELTGPVESQSHVFSGTLTSTDMSMLLSAFEGSQDVKTFSNPKVIVTSGKEAVVDMTKKRPNVVVAAKRVVNGANNTLDTDMRLMPIPGKDAMMFAQEAFFSWGVTLNVAPRVTTNGLINVRIVPTISTCEDYVTVESSSDSEVPYSKFPIIDLQRICSEFTMQSGMTAVIGGLSRTVEIEVDTGIPYLQRIPWIGRKLFGWRSREKEQREIIVFVTVGLADPEEMRADSGLPKNAILGRQYTSGLLKEPGDRVEAVKGTHSLDLSDLDDREDARRQDEGKKEP